MLRDWLTAAFFCAVFLLVIRLVLRFVSVVALWFVLPAVGSALLPAVGYALLLLSAVLFSVLFIISLLLDVERCSASASSLRCSSRSPRTGVAPLSSFHHWLVSTGFLAVALSLILSQRHFVAGYIFLDASPAPPTPLLSIAPFVIVGSRLVLGLLGRVVYNNVFC